MVGLRASFPSLGIYWQWLILCGKTLCAKEFGKRKTISKANLGGKVEDHTGVRGLGSKVQHRSSHEQSRP